MSIGDLFRSKIKHSDPEVRAQAVTEMAADQLETLAEVARDDDEFRIRRLALEKIEDAETLIGLTKSAAAPIDLMAADRAGEILARAALSDDDESAAIAAIERIAAIGSNKTLSQIAATASIVSVKRAALAAIQDDRALADVVREASDEAIAQSALGRIANQGALAAIAVSEQRKALASAALERLGEMGAARETLERIEAKAGHKSVRSRARALLTPTTEETPAEVALDPARLAHAERVQLTHAMESLSRAQDFRREAEFTAARARFEELGTGEDGELANRFERAAARYQEGLERYRARAERLAQEGKAPDPEHADDGEGAGSANGASQAAPVEAAPVATVAVEVAATADVVESVESVESVVSAESAESAEGADTPADDATAAASVGSTEEPVVDGEASEASASPEPDVAVAAQPAQPPRPKTFTPEEKRITLESLCQNLESLVTSNKIKTINKGLTRAEIKFAELGEPPTGMPELLARLERSRQALLIRVGEIREALEWQQWANIAKQEQLIARAEKLAADPGVNKLVDRLRNLQNEWKELGPAPRDRAQELWEKFKAACDLIYERVKLERKEDNEVRKNNLAAKTALCEQAEAVADSEDWGETALVLKRLQAEWKKIGPVPRRHSDKIWKRFRGACDKFFERRKPHLEERLAEFREAIDEKTALVEEMESLITDEAKARPLRERGERFDDLCRQFGRAGRVPPREFAQFRKRQDAVEKALKKERAELRAAAEAERVARLDGLRAAIDEARSAREAGTLTGAELSTRLLELRGTVKELEGEGIGKIHKALEAEIRAAIEGEPEAFKSTELDPDLSRQRKEKLCKKVEKLVPESAAPAALSPEDMAAKLRAALADRALGGVLSKQADPSTIKRVVTEARESWSRLGPVPGPKGRALEERFRGACERAQRNAE